MVGLTIAAVAAMAFVDPIGTKAADDGNPFGEPASRVESSLMLLGGVALIGLGAWVARRGGIAKDAKRDNPTT